LDRIVSAADPGGLRHITWACSSTRSSLEDRISLRANWRTAVVTGALLLFIGNGGVSWAEQTVPSGIAALLVATVSLWLVIVDWLRPGGVKPVPGSLWASDGLAGSRCCRPAHLGVQSASIHGRCRAGGRLLAWACGSLYSKHVRCPVRRCWRGDAKLRGGVILLISGLFAGEFHGCILARSRSALACARLPHRIRVGIGFSAYIYILTRAPARVATYAFVNPVVALFLGWLIVGRPSR